MARLLLLFVGLLLSLSLCVSAQTTATIPDLPADNGTVEYITLFFTAGEFAASGDYFTDATKWALGTDLLFQDIGLPADRFALDRPPQDDINHNRGILFKKLIFRVYPATSPYMTFLIFGDSLVDDQNYWLSQSKRFPPSPPYYFGAFSNGPTFVNSMRGLMRTPATGYLNKAFALDTLDMVYSRIQAFVAGRSRSILAETLVYHNGGVYDLLNAFAGALQGVRFNSTVLIGNLVAKTYRNIDALVEAGARKIVVLDITNLAGSPLVSFLNAFVAPGVATSVLQLTFGANLAIKANITGNNTAWADRGVQIVYVSSSAVLSLIAASPLGYGINDTASPAISPCCFPSGQLIPALGLPQVTTVSANAAQMLFWDDTMPSATTHYWMSQAVLQALEAAGLLPADACTSQLTAAELAQAAVDTFNHRRGRRVPKVCEGVLAETFGCTKGVYDDSAVTRLENMDFLYAEPGVANGAAVLGAGLAVVLALLAAVL